MSLLPYVIAFLMVLSAITYSRLESIKSLIASSLAFTEYASESQKSVRYEAWKEVYDEITVKIVSDTEKKYFIKGCGKLNLKALFVKDNGPPEKKKAYKEILSRLIYILHQDEPYFKIATEQNPNWIEHLIEEISNKDIKAIKDLNSIQLSDSLLSITLYNLQKENKSLSKYCTILTTPDKQNISVYLAPKELLLAIFQDQSVVDEIQKERYRISLAARRKNADMESLKNEFNSLKQAYPTSFDNYLSYDISKTKIEI